MTRGLSIVVLVIVALIVAVISVRLLIFLGLGALLGWVVMEFPSMHPQRRKVVAGAGLAILVVGVGIFLFNQFRPAPGRTDGPFTTAYRQSVTLRGGMAEVEERYVIEADEGVVLQRVAIEGEGTIQPDDGSTVEGMVVIPADSSTMAFTVTRPTQPIQQVPLGFRFWETTVPFLRATVTFQAPDEDGPNQWQVVRCRELDFLMTVETTDGRLVGANPAPERLEANQAEWRALDDFDPTDFSPQVEVQVNQVPGILSGIHGAVGQVGTKLSDSFLAVIIGGVVTSTTTTVRKEWKRRKLPWLKTEEVRAE